MVLVLAGIFVAVGLPAEPRFALVVGVGPRDTGVTVVAADLEGLGFKTELLADASLSDEVAALGRLGAALGRSPDSCGFFYYSGPAFQSGGTNYLVPSGANIPNEQTLRTGALDLQQVLDTLELAGNQPNLVVLDPVGPGPSNWGKTLAPGLGPPKHQPPGSVILYSAGLGKVPSDPNGTFPRILGQNLKIPGLELVEMVQKTQTEMESASGGGQKPAVFSQFFGTAYLAATPGTPEPAASRIGNRGPAGGFIIFDKGNRDSGWQYLEAAPAGLAPAPWFNGKDGVPVPGTGKSVGTGKDNTAKILAVQGPGAYGAAACGAYHGGGFQDWFLPSKDELDALVKVLKAKGLTGYPAAFQFGWSSSEATSREAWVENLGTGGQYKNLKGFDHVVWPVREY